MLSRTKMIYTTACSPTAGRVKRWICVGLLSIVPAYLPHIYSHIPFSRCAKDLSLPDCSRSIFDNLYFTK